MEEQMTAEEIAQHYSAAMDSVNLINNDKPEGLSDDEWIEVLSCNKEHLSIMVAKDYWTTEDLTPFTNAINS